MIKKDVYFIEVTPFRILEKKPSKTLILSSNGNYKIVDSAPLMNFKDGDYLLMSRMIGQGIVQINYLKMDNKKIREDSQKKRLEYLLSGFGGTPLFPMN